MLRFLLILVLAYPAGVFFPWWWAIVVAFLVGLLMSEKKRRRVFGKQQVPARAFLAGFLALFLLWGVMVFWINGQNEGILAEKVAQLISANPPISGPYLLILISALMGGLIGGFGAMTGNLLGEAMRN
ncbi:MAG: hypothetical protein AAF399_10640 [Bacteroidota bacterium]